jgi:hypothetical protein
MMPTALPAAARSKLSELTVQRLGAEDAARSANTRLNGLGRDADRELVSKLTAERDKHQDRFRALSLLINKVNQWVMQLHPSLTLEPAPAIDHIELKDNETLTSAIATARRQIAELQAQLKVVRSAPLPRADVMKAAEAFVEQRARIARPTTIAVMRDDQLRLAFRDDIVTSRSDVVDILCFFAPENVLDALQRAIDEQPTPVNPMPAHERQARIAELERKLWEFELLEEGLVTKAHSEGLGDILRRPDAAPSAVLGVVVAKVPAAQVA